MERKELSGDGKRVVVNLEVVLLVHFAKYLQFHADVTLIDP